MFAIELESPTVSVDSAGAADRTVGRIVIGDFVEAFRVPLGFWGESDYRRSWQRAYGVLEGSSTSRSCLMVAMTDPDFSNFLTCWPMYRDGDDVYLQNSLIFLDQLDSAFDVERPWESIGPRSVVDEDGNSISEWATSMGSLREFFGGGSGQGVLG